MLNPADDPTLQLALDLFRTTFHAEPEVAAFGPGRVNMIGEHTDYNEGFVFPLALELRTFVVGRGSLLVRPPESAKNGLLESKVVTESPHLGGDKLVVSFAADKNLVPDEPKWANYVKGVVAEYLEDIPDGKYLCFEAAIASSVPLGSGLSSSAALEVATATFLEAIIGVHQSPKDKALRCQRAEHKFAGVPCGIMDQFISACARPGKVLLLDCKDRRETHVPLSDPNLVLFITNSKVKHNLGGSEYPVRVKQCKAAVQALQKKYPDVTSLRGVTLEQLDSVKEEIPADSRDVVYRRAKHVITEDERTQAAVQALKERRYKDVGKYMTKSHESLRDDYNVSCGELDFLVEEALKVDGVLGTRMTGGGFGGCTLTLVTKDAVPALESALKLAFQKRYGIDPDIFVTVPGAGATLVDIKSRRSMDDVRQQRLMFVYLSIGVALVATVIAVGVARRGGVKNFRV